MVQGRPPLSTQPLPPSQTLELEGCLPAGIGHVLAYLLACLPLPQTLDFIFFFGCITANNSNKTEKDLPIHRQYRRQLSIIFQRTDL